MDESGLRKLLKELHFSSVLPEDVLQKFAEMAAPLEMQAGEVVFREGDVHDFLYLVAEGKIALDMFIPGRGKVRLLTVGPGEFVGWSGFLQQTAMTATATAVDDLQLVAAPAVKLNELCNANPTFGLHLTKRVAQALSRRLVATRLQLLDVFSTQPSDPPLNAAETD